MFYFKDEPNLLKILVKFRKESCRIRKSALLVKKEKLRKFCGACLR